MVLDIITAALIVIPMAIGMARGVLYVAVRALGWVGALAASFFLNSPVSRWMEKGPVGKMVYGSLEEKFGGPVESVETATEGLPQIIGGAVSETANETADMLVNTIGGIIISIMSFIAMALVIRIIMFFIIKATSRRGVKKGIPVLTRMNKLAGMIVGGGEGLLLAFVFLAALIPVMNISSPETAESIVDGLKYSHLAGPLYQGNLLTLMASGIL